MAIAIGNVSLMLNKLCRDATKGTLHRKNQN